MTGAAPAPLPILIPAAGASRRMGGTDKLLETVAGETLLHRQARIAVATGGPVFVTLPPGAAARVAALGDLDVTRVAVPDAAEGMAASLRRGAAALPPAAAGVLILLADLPEITAPDLVAMVWAFAADPDAPILRATAEDGTPGHPVVIPRRLFADLAALRGDTGARAILHRHPDAIRSYPLAGRRAVTDLDTPGDWRAWRARQSRQSSA